MVASTAPPSLKLSSSSGLVLMGVLGMTIKPERFVSLVTRAHDKGSQLTSSCRLEDTERF